MKASGLTFLVLTSLTVRETFRIFDNSLAILFWVTSTFSTSSSYEPDHNKDCDSVSISCTVILNKLPDCLTSPITRCCTSNSLAMVWIFDSLLYPKEELLLITFKDLYLLSSFSNSMLNPCAKKFWSAEELKSLNGSTAMEDSKSVEAA